MVILQQMDKNQMVKLLNAIDREGVDSKFWDIIRYNDSWNAGEVFGGTNQTEFEPGDYITVMYDEDNMFPTFDENLSIVTSFPHYDYWIEEDLRVLIFRVNFLDLKQS